MKIIKQSVELISPQTFEDGEVLLKRIELAGRNCWQSEEKITDDSYKSFIKTLMKRNHGSPLEFGHVMMKIVTSRDVMAELTRHRTGVSFAIESQRYVLENKDDDGIRYIAPVGYNEDPNDLKWETWRNQILRAEWAYKDMISHGFKNQDARKVLPNSTATTIMMDVNVRELLHIIKLRSSIAAYPEMRQMIELMVEQLKTVLPLLFSDEGDEANANG